MRGSTSTTTSTTTNSVEGCANDCHVSEHQSRQAATGEHPWWALVDDDTAQPALPLTVTDDVEVPDRAGPGPTVTDSSRHAAETRRFWSHVVRGPGEWDCWLWVGAIADDGYGRFWITRPTLARSAGAGAAAGAGVGDGDEAFAVTAAGGSVAAGHLAGHLTGHAGGHVDRHVDDGELSDGGVVWSQRAVRPH